jgi:hypothetical protein
MPRPGKPFVCGLWVASDNSMRSALSALSVSGRGVAGAGLERVATFGTGHF